MTTSGLIPIMHGWFNIQQTNIVIDHINRLSRKKIIQSYQLVEKKHLKNPVDIYDKSSKYVINREELSQLKKENLPNYPANILCFCERLNVFSLRLVVRQGWLLISLLSNIVLKVLATEIRQEKE